MIVLGIDPGTAAMGYGIVERTGSSLRAVDYGCLTTSPDSPLPERLLQCHALVTELIETHRPDLLAVERDPARVVEELYLAFLCRFPRPEEVEAVRFAFDVSDPANRAALDPESDAELSRRLEAFAAAHRPARFEPARFLSGRASSGAVFEAAEDGSVRITGALPDKDTYTIRFTPTLPRITAIQVEALTDDSLSRRGPGRAPNGNFVLTDVRLRSESGPVALKAASADYSQNGYPVSGVLDGDTATGWAVDATTKYRWGVDHAIPLSDHADFDQLIEAVRIVQPRAVYCTHGPNEFVDHLRDLGFNAFPLCPPAQGRLF